MPALKVWDGTTWVWVSQPTAALDQLQDVTVTSPVTGSVIRWDGVIWRDAVLAQSDISGLVAALAAKEPTIAAGTTAQYWRGDKTWQTLDKATVGLAVVDNTSDANKPVSTATQTALNLKVNKAGDTMTGNLVVPSVEVTSNLILTEIATPGTLPASGTRQFYAKSDGKLYVRSPVGVESVIGGDAIAPVQPAEPTGTIEGALWYDSDDDQFLVDVSYVQAAEPTGAVEGALWLDTDDPTAHTDADHTGLAPIGHTHAPPDLSGYATTSHVHDKIIGSDGRGSVPAPSTFTQATTRHAPRFQTGAELGLPQSSYSVETIAPWTDDTGGGVHQIARGYGETWERYGLRSGAWGAWRIPGGGWQKIATVSPSGASNTVGNLSFTNIPNVYKRLRIRSSWLQYGTTNNNGSLLLRFNSDAAANYGQNMQYANTATWNGTYSINTSTAYAAYVYFYSGAAASQANVFNLAIWRTGKGQAQWKAENEATTGAASYVYRSQVTGTWNSTAAITRIDLWTDNAYTWNASSVVTLEGSLEE